MNSQAVPSRVHVYIDGFNLYYGSLKGTPYKWLDLGALCRTLLPGDDIRLIRYFTAELDPTPSDPDLPIRQATYMRALRTVPRLWIKEGFFLTKPSRKRKVYPLYGPDPKVPNPSNRAVWIWKTEEKGSDVNLATALLLDAAANDFDRAWVISNDSDLAWPIWMVRKTYRKQVGVWKPDRPKGYPSSNARPDSKPLIRHARWFKRIEESQLAACQFPTTLTDKDGSFSKPTAWP